MIRRNFLIMSALLGCLLPQTPAFAKSLRALVQTLATQEGFQLEGADQLGSERAAKPEGDLPEQLEQLLKDYNYLLTYGDHGKLAKVRITSVKQTGPRPSDRAYVQTARVGSHHQVAAELTGPNGDRVPVDLMVDTGATMIVLPESLMQPLGFGPESLGNGMSQTASDTVKVKVGMLRLVRIGGVSAEQVHVSFMPDDKLNGTKLLGMSFLNHFKFSLDDDANELILLSK